MNILEKFKQFQIIYDFSKDTRNTQKIQNILTSLSNKKLKEWNLEISEGRIEVFQLFEDLFTPYFSLNNKRFEIYISDKKIKINFPEEDFYRIKGPKGYYRVVGFPQKETDQTTSKKELEELKELVNLILLSKFSLKDDLKIDIIELIFHYENNQKTEYKKINEFLSKKAEIKINFLDFNVEEEGNIYNLELMGEGRIKGNIKYNKFSILTDFFEILEFTDKKINEFVKMM